MVVRQSTLKLSGLPYYGGKSSAKDIRHPLAYQNSKIVHIMDMERGAPGLYCTGCGLPMKANIGRGIRKRHFAHVRGNPRCRPDSYLHSIAEDTFARSSGVQPH